MRRRHGDHHRFLPAQVPTALERNRFKLNRLRFQVFAGGMIFSEDRSPLFRIMPYRPNSLSSSQKSSPLALFCRLSGGALGAAAATGACGAGAGGGLNQLSAIPGSVAGAVPASAARMKWPQISTGSPPPTAFLVGELSSL